MTSGEAGGQAKQKESDGCHSPVWGAPLPGMHFYSQSQVVIVFTVASWLTFRLHYSKLYQCIFTHFVLKRVEKILTENPPSSPLL